MSKQSGTERNDVSSARDAKTWKSEVDPATSNLNRVEDLLYGYFVECRWESLFCEIVRDLAKRATNRFSW